jgi:hypothetical protein
VDEGSIVGYSLCLASVGLKEQSAMDLVDFGWPKGEGQRSKIMVELDYSSLGEVPRFKEYFSGSLSHK